MRYFRHFSNARTSIKLQNLRADLGMAGYGKYWALMELLNDKFDGVTTSVEIHHKEMQSTLQARSVELGLSFIRSLVELGLLTIEGLNPTSLIIGCPILVELMDKDSKYNRKTRKDATLEVKVEVKVDKEVKVDTFKSDEFYPVTFENNLKKEISFETLSELFNRILSGQGKIQHAQLFCPPSMIDNLRETIQKPEFQKIEFWEKYFERVKISNFLKGNSKTNFTVNLLWLIKLENAYKVLSGQYDNTLGDGIDEEYKARMKALELKYDGVSA